MFKYIFNAWVNIFMQACFLFEKKKNETRAFFKSSLQSKRNCDRLCWILLRLKLRGGKCLSLLSGDAWLLLLLGDFAFLPKAARNCLVDSDLSVKVSDFGMTR